MSYESNSVAYLFRYSSAVNNISMKQEYVNPVVDYYYKLQKDETDHQNHRVMWILTAQALIFTGLCTLAPKVCEGFDVRFIGCLLVVVGVSISISGIYSVAISTTSIGTIYERWHAYDKTLRQKKPKVIPHLVSAAPSDVLDSKFRFLMFYTFAPNVFCTAWIILALKMFGLLNYNHCVCYLLLFFGILVAVCLASYLIYRFSLYKWVYVSSHDKKDDKEDDDDNTDCMCRHSPQSPLSPSPTRFIACPMPRCGSYPCYDYTQHTDPYNRKSRYSNWRIYHIMVDRFNGNWDFKPENRNDFLGGNIQGVIDKLDYIHNMGYNAIMLTPICETVGYHGYHIKNYDKVDPHFGDETSLYSLVNAVHERGMKIICDYVPNHCSYYHYFFQEALNNKFSPYRKWFYFKSPYSNEYVSYQNFPDLPKINLYNEDASDYIISVAEHLATIGVDGIRIDHVIGVPFCFLKKMRSRIKRINPDLFLFGEAWIFNLKDLSQLEFKDYAQEKRARLNILTQDEIQLNYVGYLDGVLDFTFNDLLVSSLQRCQRLLNNSSLKSDIESHFKQYPEDFELILFLDNHDTNRFRYYCKNNGVVDETLFYEGKVMSQNFYRYPFSVYYGTEDKMLNDEDIFNPERPDADLNVRCCKDW